MIASSLHEAQQQTSITAQQMYVMHPCVALYGQSSTGEDTWQT